MTSTSVIILFSIILCFILISTYLYLLIIKVVNRKKAQEKQSWIDKHQDEIEQYLLHGDINKITFIPKKSYQFSAIEDFFSDYLSNFKVDKVDNPIKKFVEHFLIEEYRKRLRSREWSVRMNTLYFLDLFQLEKMENDLLRRLKSPDLTNEEEYQIYILLV